jgi:hypothetical protein
MVVYAASPEIPRVVDHIMLAVSESLTVIDIKIGDIIWTAAAMPIRCYAPAPSGQQHNLMRFASEHYLKALGWKYIKMFHNRLAASSLIYFQTVLCHFWRELTR